LAPLPQTARGESIKLEADPNGKTFAYTNGKSVFMRDLEVKPEIKRQFRENALKSKFFWFLFLFLER
jgi:hypothetical protein